MRTLARELEKDLELLHCSKAFLLEADLAFKVDIATLVGCHLVVIVVVAIACCC